ncbi:MAG: heavy metal-responsive transcriptional regulator [Bdellovibrionales bacterium]|nr:heavy metal-responsive transcriptional regulator [Bdellovibrionales bacterium]
MNEKHPTFTIGRLSKMANVNIQAIRYYEREDLLEPVIRKDSGYRLYNDESLKRLHFILEAKNLGFTLKEIQSLLSLRIQSKTRCDHVRKRTEMKLKNVRQKIGQLRKIERTLKKLILDCENRVISDQCPILEQMEG